jgi:hypothetical protein
MSAKERADLNALCSEAALLHERLHRAGLHRTAQKMHAVVQSVGWEVAEKLGGDKGAESRDSQAKDRALAHVGRNRPWR